MFTLTWYGNAGVKVQAGDAAWVFDPFITRNPALPVLRPEDLAGVGAIVITHGHFDHVEALPGFASRIQGPVLAPARVAETLVRSGRMKADRLRGCDFGLPIRIGECELTMLHGRHVRFDARLILETLLRTLHSFRQAAALLERQSPAGEVAVWQARCQGQTLLHFGSLGLDPTERYPAPVDVLSLPLQGSSRIYDLALAAVEKMRPRVVFFHHFDDAFPPVSAQIPTQPMLDLLRQKAPGVKAVAPVFGVPVEIE